MADAIVSRSRVADADIIIPRSVLCELVFTLGQLHSRLTFRTPNPPGRVDAAILENARTALTNARAVLTLATRR